MLMSSTEELVFIGAKFPAGNKNLFGWTFWGRVSLGSRRRLIKTSVCLLYMELFPLRSLRIAAYCAIGISNVFALTVILSITFICLPVKSSLEPTVHGTCGNCNALWLVLGILNILTDILILMLPMPFVWGLQLPRKKRFALIQ
jgi:hypothetical protein